MSQADKLNVLFLPSRYPTAQLPVNGQFVRDYAQAVNQRHNVTVLYLASSAGPYRDYDDAGVRTIMHAVRFSGMGVGLVRYIVAGLRDFARLRRRFKPDVIHVHLAYPAGVLGLAISRRYRIPMVLSEQAESVKVFNEGVIKNLLARRIIRAMRVICPTSRATQNLLSEYSKGPFVVVPPVIDTRLFHYAPSASAAGGDKRILVVAPLVENKGVGYLLQGLGQLRQQRSDFTLDIVGEGAEEQRYRQLAADLGLAEWVRFLGPRARASVASLLQQCDFAVVPSTQDIENQFAVAALASGKPVVSSRWIGADELIISSVGRVVERASAEALRDGVGWMLDHSGDFDPQAIVAHALAGYGKSGVAAQFDAVYRQVIG